LEEATRLSKAILASNSGHSEWRICAGCLQIVAECCRLEASYSEEQEYRRRTLEVHEKNLGRNHRDTVDVMHDLADCYLNNSKYSEADDLYQEVIIWRNAELGSTHVDTLRAIECLGVCYAHQGRDDEAIAAYLAAIDRQSRPNARLLHNLCVALQHQGKWEMLEKRARQLHELDDEYRHRAVWSLMNALEQQDRTSEALDVRSPKRRGACRRIRQCELIDALVA
ncbi:MAG: hypothetical protein L6R42_011375, partial [Xanthoria sp. 1 TBL-2021]